MASSRIKALFVDYGGVLTPALPEITPKDQAIAAAAGISAEDLHKKVWTGVDESSGVVAEALRGHALLTAVIAERQRVLDRLGIKADAESLIWRTIYRPVLGEVVESVRRARSAGVLTVLTSNQYPEFVPMIRERLDLDSVFDDVAFSCDQNVQTQKPLREYFELVLSRHSLRPGEVLFMDDALANIEMAQSMGIRCIHVKDHLNAVRQLDFLINLQTLGTANDLP